MALSDWDKQHLNANQQRAVQTYSAEWEKAKREGNEERMQWAHNGAEAIRKQAGYSGGDAGGSFRPTATVKADTKTGTVGYDNGGLENGQVKAIQKALGVKQDGYFGPKTQEAAFQRWGASDANSALKAFLTTNTPKQTSFSFDEDEGLYHWNGKTYSSQKELTDAMNKAGLSAAEKNVVNRKAESSGSGVKLSGGSFSGKPSTAAQSAKVESKGSNVGTSSTASHTGSGRSLDSTPEQELAAVQAKLDAANAQYAGAARYGTIAERKELRAEIKELEQQVKDLKKAEGNPSLLERLGKTLSGTAKQYGGSLANAAGVASDTVGGTAMSSVYRDQVDMLDRQIEALERIMSDPSSTKEDIADASDALRIAREQRAIYGNAVRAGEGTANEVYKLSDDLSQSGAADIDRAKQGASKLGKVGIDVFSQGAQMAADVGLGAVTGVGALGPMAVRSFGGGAQEARQGGANLQQAALYGAGNAAVEVLTEKMFDGLAGIYGKGAADDIVKGAINRLTKNEAARRALGVAASATGESVEELVSGLVNPALRAIYNGKSVGQNYSELEAQDILYDMLIGGILGGLGGTVDVARESARTGDATRTTPVAPHADASEARTAQASNPSPAEVTPTAAPQTPVSASVEQNARQTLTPQEFMDRYRAQVNPNAGVGEMLANYDALMREYQRQVDEYEEGKKTVNVNGFDMTLADMKEYFDHTARLNGTTPPPAQAIKAAFDADYDRQQSGENKIAASDTEAAAVPVSPAHGASLAETQIDPRTQPLGETPTRDMDIVPSPEELVNAKSAARYMKEHGDAAYTDAFLAAMNRGDIKENAAGGYSVAKAKDHIDNRTDRSVGARSVKPFQYLNPEVHPYYKSVAEILLDELNEAEKGGQVVPYSELVSGEGGVYDTKYKRTKRQASDAISDLLDNNKGVSYKQLQKALEDIIADKEHDNYALAKRVELEIDSLLENDYFVTREQQPLSQLVDVEAYRTAKDAIRGAEARPTEHEDMLAGVDDVPETRADVNGQQPENDHSNATDRRSVNDERNLTERNDSVGSARAAFTPEQVQSRDSSTASALNEDERQIEGLRPEDATHQKLTNAESVARAKERLELDYAGEEADLPNIRDWTAVEMDMAQMILRDKVTAARASGDYSEVVKWKKLIDERKSTTGQALQANAKYAGDPASIVSTAAETLEGSKLSAKEKAEVLNTISRQADKLGGIEDGDTVSLAELVKENSMIRRTNSLFGNKLSKTMEKLIDGDSSDHLRLVAQAQLESMASDYAARSGGSKAKSARAMMMLSNLATVTRNLSANNIFDPIDSLANNAAVPVDMLLSKFTGTRSTALDGSWFSKAKRQASAEALARSAIEVALDIDTDAAGGANRYGQSSKRTFKMTGSPVERFLSTWAKWQGYLLNTTDEFQKGGIQAETQRGIDALKAQGRIKDDSLDAAGENMAKYRTFQDDTRLSRGVGMIHDAGNALLGTKDKSFGLGDVVIPFGKVPSNLVGRVWDYSPAGVAKGVYDLFGVLDAAHKGKLTAEQQAKAMHELGRGATGSALIAGFAYLAKLGILHVVGDDEDKDKAALDAAEGKTGAQLNLSAMARLFKGESPEWQKGDDLMSVGSLEPISALMTIGALVAEDIDEDGLSAKDYAKDTAYGTLQSILDLPGMSTIQSMTNAYKYSDEPTAGGKLKDAALDTAADIPLSFIPNALKAAARGTDNNYRDLYSETGVLPQTRDAALASIPGARQTLPDVLDPFGREKTYTDNATQNFLNATILPGAIMPYKQDAVSAELERLYEETGEVGMYPNKSAPSKVSVDGKEVELTEDQRRAYQMAYGETAHKLMEEMQNSPEYKRADDKDKVLFLSKCLSYATDAAKEQVLGAKLSTSDANARDAQKLYGISTADYLRAKAATAGISGNVKDSKGDGIENSQSLLLMQAIYKTGATEGMSDKKRKEFFQSLGVNKTTCGYSSKMVENKLKAMEKKYGLKLVA